MNTNTFLFNNDINSYWNPLKLASSPRLNKTHSYEELPIEDKVVRLENSFINLQKTIPNTDECKKVFLIVLIIMLKTILQKIWLIFIMNHHIFMKIIDYMK